MDSPSSGASSIVSRNEAVAKMKQSLGVKQGKSNSPLGVSSKEGRWGQGDRGCKSLVILLFMLL